MFPSSLCVPLSFEDEGILKTVDGSPIWLSTKKGSIFDLGGGNSNIFYFQPDPRGFMIQFDEHIFQVGWFIHQVGWFIHQRNNFLHNCKIQTFQPPEFSFENLRQLVV